MGNMDGHSFTREFWTYQPSKQSVLKPPKWALLQIFMFFYGGISLVLFTDTGQYRTSHEVSYKKAKIMNK